MGKLTISMAIFNSYDVKLPDGTLAKKEKQWNGDVVGYRTNVIWYLGPFQRGDWLPSSLAMSQRHMEVPWNGQHPQIIYFNGFSMKETIQLLGYLQFRKAPHDTWQTIAGQLPFAGATTTCSCTRWLVVCGSHPSSCECCFFLNHPQICKDLVWLRFRNLS